MLTRPRDSEYAQEVRAVCRERGRLTRSEYLRRLAHVAAVHYHMEESRRWERWARELPKDEGGLIHEAT